jgi:membrane associated rhomboid family serine protease
MEDNYKLEKKRFYISLVYAGLFLLLLWLVWFVEIMLDLDFAKYGLFPRRISGLKGILFAPLIHANIKHLFDNSVPMLVLMTALFYFYPDLSLRIFLWNYLMVGIWVWVGGREAYHIGASGLVYGLASFLFFSGVFRNYIRLMAVSLLVVFLYGSLVWGIFPIKDGISWESHLLGGIAGLTLAIYYRKSGPQKPEHHWDDEDQEDEEEEEIVNSSRH